jgi:putative DNA primase/helicase
VALRGRRSGQAKPLKVPYWTTGAAQRGTQGSDHDRAKLVTLAEARRCYELGNYSGVGFAFLPGDGLIGIDIDGAIDLETGEVSQRCRPSSRPSPAIPNIHPAARAPTSSRRVKRPPTRTTSIGLEIFAGRQYFTFTGQHWAGTPAAR